MSALEGQARSTEVAISFFMGAWVVAVPMAYVLAFVHDYGLMGLWYAIVVGYVVVTVLSLYFYCRSDWANIILHAQSLRTHPAALDHTPLLDPGQHRLPETPQTLSNNRLIGWSKPGDTVIVRATDETV